ncbi:hypothetical protein [Micromonospora chersina]
MDLGDLHRQFGVLASPSGGVGGVVTAPEVLTAVGRGNGALTCGDVGEGAA